MASPQVDCAYTLCAHVACVKQHQAVPHNQFVRHTFHCPEKFGLIVRYVIYVCASNAVSASLSRQRL